jgi:hypothetical protein
MRATRLMESHRNRANSGVGFGLMNPASGSDIVNQALPLTRGPRRGGAKRIRAAKSPENASELWITR